MNIKRILELHKLAMTAVQAYAAALHARHELKLDFLISTGFCEIFQKQFGTFPVEQGNMRNNLPHGWETRPTDLLMFVWIRGTALPSVGFHSPQSPLKSARSLDVQCCTLCPHPWSRRSPPGTRMDGPNTAGTAISSPHLSCLS